MVCSFVIDAAAVSAKICQVVEVTYAQVFSALRSFYWSIHARCKLHVLSYRRGVTVKEFSCPQCPKTVIKAVTIHRYRQPRGTPDEPRRAVCCGGASAMYVLARRLTTFNIITRSRFTCVDSRHCCQYSLMACS